MSRREGYLRLMQDFDFDALEDDLHRSLLLDKQEEDMLARGRMIAEEMAEIGHVIDPLTFLLTDFHDLCKFLRLNDEQSIRLTHEFTERGTFARVLEAMKEFAYIV
jgi:hypothetical protein